jgi:exonuclease SbcC
VANLRGRLGDDAGVAVDELQIRAATLQSQRRDADAAHRRVVALDAEDVRLSTRERELGERLAGLAEAAALQERTKQEREAVAEQARVAAAGVEPAAAALCRAVVAAARPLCDGLGRVFEAVAAANGAVIEADGRLRSVLDASPFDSVEAARAVLLPEPDEKARLQAAVAHRDAVRTASAVLETLEQQGVPEECPDVAVAEATAAAAEAESTAVRDAFTTARNARAAAVGHLHEYDALAAASEEVRDAYALARKAHRVLAYGGALGMPLRRWVLANELDRVSAAANVHLQRMTASRYTLQRRLDVVDGRRSFGLDLEVVDAHTGRARSTGSLSGGEQFQASLALALGLADVVSHGGHASGRRFEALFVDEGFGSLDPTALQEAIGAMHQLQATGRMVGAITHVEAMKQDLHVGIEVRRLPDGRGSTLRVNP